MSVALDVFLVILLAVATCHSLPKSETPLAEQEEAVRALLIRLLPFTAYQFHVNITRALPDHFVSVRQGVGETIEVGSGSGVGAAYGIARYLRQAGAHFAWNHFSVPPFTRLPTLNEPIDLTALGQLRYMSNVCTFSYSYVWWGWAEWEMFIDWMALSGINFPLSHVGAEGVWRRVWLGMGLSDDDLEDYFTGPAFLAWHRMGNLMKWSGPLSPEWHEGQLRLQRQILARMSSLGMVPILPAFPGFLPRAFKKLYPAAAISQSADWVFGGQEYTGLDFLDPRDPMFRAIGAAYINEMRKVYGTVYHAYSVDVFNELTPASFQPDYLFSISFAIYAAMATADPKAHWVMQAWLFQSNEAQWRANDSVAARALITSVPKVVLDLASERAPEYEYYKSYFGQPWIWNTIQDFGGNLELDGRVGTINQGISRAVGYPNSSLVGVGLTMEGIYNNYPVYQFTLDRAWGKRPWPPLNLTQWITNYATERYGGSDEDLAVVWRNLWDSLFNDVSDAKGGDLVGERLGIHHPHVNFLFKRPALGKVYQTWYNASFLCDAWRVFVKRAPVHGRRFFFRQDLVDISRQALELVGLRLYARVQRAYEERRLGRLRGAGRAFLRWWSDLDRLLDTNSQFQLGAWIQAAKNKARTGLDRALFERNARNQVTMWGPTGNILDYARKQWAGLAKDYYRPRWELFIKELRSAVAKKQRFDHERFKARVLQLVEMPFTNATKVYAFNPVGDSVAISRELLAKYGAKCK